MVLVIVVCMLFITTRSLLLLFAKDREQISVQIVFLSGLLVWLKFCKSAQDSIASKICQSNSCRCSTLLRSIIMLVGIEIADYAEGSHI
jgi:hypothetical protein